jgi:lysyl-tRNA synthetase class 2
LYLIPSPEIWMKKVIAQHGVNVYQVCKCFRNGESSGHLHNSEFTMLEYYTMNVGYLDSLSLTEDLFAHLTKEANAGAASFLPFERITIADAFKRHAGFDLFEAVEKNGALEQEAKRLGLQPAPGTETGVLYD